MKKQEWSYHYCCDYIKKYSRPIGFLYFYRPINIILSADWSDYIKDITRRSQNLTIGRSSADTSADQKRRATVGRSSANGRPTHRPMICGSFKYDIGRLPKPQNCRPMEKKYNKVILIYFCRPMKKELECGILSAGINRPNIGRPLAGLM